MTQPPERVVAEGVEIRRASEPDRSALLEMYREFEPKGACLGLPPHKNHAAWLEHLGSYVNFLAKAGGKVVGHGVLCPEGYTAEIAIFVHQDFRGRGIGRKLVKELIGEAQRLGVRRVWGLTESDNIPMLRLLRQFGFQPSHDPVPYCWALGEGQVSRRAA
jgi:GNAT superfamily N-acetyltransferase